MSCMFEIPYGVFLASIPLLVQIDTSMATRYSPTQGVDRNVPVILQKLRSHGNHSHGRQYCSLRPPLNPRSGTLTSSSLAVPALLAGKVDFLPYPFLDDTTILDLSRSLGLLNLEDQEPRDYDESADRHTSREHNSRHTDALNNHTDRPSSGDLPLSTNTRSRHRRQGSDGGGSPPRRGRTEDRSFNRYGPAKSTLEINSAIKDILLRQHADVDEGYVYGFQHPDDVSPGPLSTEGDDNGRPHLVKIGRSKNHQARMRQISKRCKYVPHTAFAHLTFQHAMVERVVHTQLHNSRLRDVGCAGCGTRHEEWFEVEVDRAEHLVALWKAFAECDPYDEHGEILSEWRKRLDRLDLGDADCWEHFVHGAPLAQPAASSPQELEAETAPVRLVAGQIDPSSDGNSGRNNRDEDQEVV